MVGFLVGAQTGNDSHATACASRPLGAPRRPGTEGRPLLRPNCGVRLNDGQAFDFVAHQPIGAGQELTFDYPMRNFTIDHFPTVPVRRRAVPRLGHRLEGSARRAQSRLRRARRALPAHDGDAIRQAAGD